jgi:hypothetical protein
MDEFEFYDFNACKTKSDRIKTMTPPELRNYKKVLEEDKIYLEENLKTFVNQDKLLETEITEIIQKIGEDKSKDMVKNLEKIKKRYNLAKNNNAICIIRNSDRGVTFQSVICNRLYNKIVHYETIKMNKTNAAMTYLNNTNDALLRVKEKLVNIENTVKFVKIVKKKESSEEEEFEREGKFRTNLVKIECVSDDW